MKEHKVKMYSSGQFIVSISLSFKLSFKISQLNELDTLKLTKEIKTGASDC